MSSAPKQDSPEAPFLVGRRSARLSMIIPITIHGMDSGGQLFRENTWTIGVNKQGAKIATFRPLPLGGQISVINPVLGRTAKARIIWVGEKRFPEDPYEVGVELVEAQNVWGIKFPPEDWQKPAAAAKTTRGPEAESAAAPAPAKPDAPEAAKPPEAPKSTEAPAAAAKDKEKEKDKDSGAPPEKFNQFNLAMAALSHFAQQAETKVEGRSAQPPGGLPGVVELLEQLQEKEKNLRSLEVDLKSQAERLESSRERIEALLAKAEAFERGLASEVERTRGTVEQAREPALQSALQELDAKLRQEIESVSSRLARLTEESATRAAPELQTREKLATEQAQAEINRAAEAAAADFREQLAKIAGEREKTFRPEIENLLEGSAQQLLERLSQSFEERAQSVSGNAARALEEKVEKLQAQVQGQSSTVWQRCEQEAEEFRKLISDRVNSAVESLNAAAGAAAAKLYDAYQKTESDFKSLNEYSTRKMAELSSSGLEGYRQKTLDLLADFQASLEKTGKEFQEKGVREASERVQKNSEEVLESWARQLQKQADDVLEMMTDQFKESGAERVEETKQQLAEAARSSRQALDAEARGAVETVKTLSEKLAASSQALLEETAKQLAGVTRVVLESLRQEARNAGEACRGEAQKTLLEFKERGPRELEANLEKTVQRYREAMQTELEKQARSSTEQALAEIRSRSEQVAKQASETVYKQVGVGAVVLKDWADQARTQLESFLQSSVEGFEKQLAGISESSLEKHRQGSEVLAEDLRARLQLAARIFHEEGASPAGTKPQEASSQPVQAPSKAASGPAPAADPSQGSGITGQESDPLIERLKKRQEQAVSEAAEAFRKKLAEMLSPFGQKPGEPGKKS